MRIFCIALFIAIACMCQMNDGICQDEVSNGKYHLVRSHYDNGFVGGINALSFVKFYRDFNISPTVSDWYWGNTFYLNRYSDKLKTLLRVGVYPSVETAENVALEYFNQSEAKYNESKEMGVGDNCWISTIMFQGDTKPRLNGLAFLRKNVFMLITSGAIYSSNYIDILPIAHAIDSLLINGSPDVMIVNEISPPKIDSVQILKSELREGEVLPLTVSATDPKGKRLEYHSGPGILNSNGKENEFLICASKANIPEPFYGTHTFEVWVVNEENLFSQKNQFQITF